MLKKSIFVTGMVALLSLAALAINATVSSTQQPSGTQPVGESTWTYDVTITDSDEENLFRDFHIYPRGGRQLNVDTGSGKVQCPDGWSGPKKGANGGLVFTCPAKKAGDGTFKFGFTVKRDTESEQLEGSPCDVVLTDTGEVARENDDEIDAVVRNGPTKMCSVTAPEPFGDHWSAAYAVHLGANTVFDLTLGLEGGEYRLFHSIVSLPDFADELGLGIDSLHSPVPSEWGLNFQPEFGVLQGGHASFSIEVPDDPALTGREFYLVAALVDGAGEPICASYDIKVTILP